MTWNNGVFKKLGIPGPKPTPVLGTLKGAFEGVSIFSMKLIDPFLLSLFLTEKKLRKKFFSSQLVPEISEWVLLV